MTTYRCETCGCVETLSIWPDCCSLCGSTYAADSSSFDAVAAQERQFEAFERACNEDAYVPEAPPLPPVALLGLGLAIGSFIAVALMPSGFEACIERQSASTCHNALYR